MLVCVSSCWGLNRCANTSISLLFNWISSTLKLWPQKCGYETLWLHGKEIHAYWLLGTSVLASFPCGSTPVQKHLNPWSMASHCLLVTNVCFPRCLIASSPEATFLLHFFLMSILMDSWQISDLCFHSFTFPGGRFRKKKQKQTRGGHFLKIWNWNTIYFI